MLNKPRIYSTEDEAQEHSHGRIMDMFNVTNDA